MDIVNKLIGLVWAFKNPVLNEQKMKWYLCFNEYDCQRSIRIDYHKFIFEKGH